MRIKKDVLTQKLAFVGIDSSDHITRKTGLSSFTVYYSLNGGVATAMTTPTVAELDATNMEGDYTLLVDEAGMVSAAGELTLSITATGMDPVTRIVEITTNLESDIPSDVWDEILTGTTHNIVNSAGRRVREIGAYAIHSGTAQAGNATCITLTATASAIDGTYNRNLLVLTDNTGVGQTRTIVDYDGSTKIAIIDREWRTNPDATTVYQIVADDTPLVVDQGVALAGSTSSTIKLRAYASSTNDIYLCNIIIIIAGTGRGQARLVGSYNGTSKVVTICGDNWITTPDDTSVYVMIPYGATCTNCINDDALAQFNTEMDNVLDTAVPGSPTAGSINQRTKAIDELTEANGSGDLAAIKAKTDNLPSGIAKNVALPKFDIFMVLSSDHVTGATGKTVTGEIMKDGAAFIGITNAITEVSAGVYTIASGLTQAEMNADAITLKFTATDCDQRTMGILTS